MGDKRILLEQLAKLIAGKVSEGHTVLGVASVTKSGFIQGAGHRVIRKYNFFGKEFFDECSFDKDCSYSELLGDSIGALSFLVKPYDIKSNIIEDTPPYALVKIKPLEIGKMKKSRQ